MRLKICHDPEKRTLTIPHAALQMSRLAEEEKLDLLAESGFILAAREDLSTTERLGMAKTLSDLAITLIVRLAESSLEAAKESRCGDCAEDCGLTIPPCLLEQAGIDADNALEASAEGGRIVITAAELEEGDNDPFSSQDAGFLSMLEGCGIDLDGLRVLLNRENGANG